MNVDLTITKTFGINVKVVLKLQTKDIVTEISLEVHKSIVIGRGETANIKVADGLMSSNHCKLTFTPNKLELTDLESKNGTYLNELRAWKSDIFIGDVITFGASKITILKEKMDPESVSAITFKGPARDRQSAGLKLDYTGAGMVNQGMLDLIGNEKNTAANVKNTKFKLTKQEIILKNKSKASLGSTIDTILMFIVLAIPLITSNVLIFLSPALFQEYRLKIMFALVVAFLGVYFYINYKVLKFTLGEKLAGIEKLFLEQDGDD